MCMLLCGLLFFAVGFGLFRVCSFGFFYFGGFRGGDIWRLLGFIIGVRG